MNPFWIQAFEGARGRADSPVSVMDMALDAQFRGTGDLVGGGNGRS